MSAVEEAVHVMNMPSQEPFSLAKMLQEAVHAETPVTEDEVFSTLINRLAANPLFADVHEWEVKGTWQRPVRPKTFKYFKFAPITPENYLRYGALTTNRMLTALNEATFLFLPENRLEGDWARKSFYTEEFRTLSALVTPQLQRYALGFVDENVTVSGQWTKKKFQDYFEERITPLKIGRAHV